MEAGQKDPGALKTIGELSQQLGVAQHILRYWETKFPELRPMQRAGNRRYYRPADVELAERINRLLNVQGYTVRGVQKLLRNGGMAHGEAHEAAVPAPPMPEPEVTNRPDSPAIDVFRLIALRDRLMAALDR